MGGSPGELSEELVMQEKRKKGWRMSCDVGEETERLENELYGGKVYSGMLGGDRGFLRMGENNSFL